MGDLVPELQVQQLHTLRQGALQLSRQRPCQQPLHYGLGSLLAVRILRQSQRRPHRPDAVAAPGLLLGNQVVDQRPLLPALRLGRGGAGRQRQAGRQQPGDSPLHALSSFSAALGRVTVNRVPPLGRLSARIAPPRRLTVSLTMLSPSPVPPAARERALSTR